MRAVHLSFAIWLLAASVNASTRVALVSTCGGEAGVDVLALAEAKLSQEPDIELVERTEVERVLNELKLTHCGPSQSRQAVTTGRMLGVEVFASLETIPKEKRALGLVVFDAGSGVRLSDAVLPDGEPAVTAAAVSDQVRASCDKRRQPATGLRPVCILSVRNADLPLALDSWCQSVGVMLRRRLVQSTGLTLLERERLEHVNRERPLPTDTASTNLLAAAVLVELEIGREGAGNGRRATALLSDSGGNKLGETAPVRVENENAADLSERLLAALIQALHSAPVPALTDRDREADRFLREADYLTRTGEPMAGLHAAEAAFALAPTNAAAKHKLIGCLQWHAQSTYRTPDSLKPSLSVATRALDMLREVYLGPKPLMAPLDWWAGPSPWIHTALLTQLMSATNGQGAATIEKVFEYRRQLVDLHMEVLCRRASEGVTEALHFNNRAVPLINWMNELDRVTLSADEWTANLIACLRAWLVLAERFPLTAGDIYMSNTRPMNRVCYLASSPQPSRWKLQPEHYRQFAAVFADMRQHPDPIVQCYGVLGQFHLKLRDHPYPSADAMQEFNRTKAFIRDKVATAKREPILWCRGLLYSALLDLTDTLPDLDQRHREYAEQFEFMLQRQEIEYWTTRMVTDPDSHTFRQYDGPARGGWPDVFPRHSNRYPPTAYPELVQNAQRVLALHATNSAKLNLRRYVFNTGSFERELAWVQRDLPQSKLAQPPAGPAWENPKLLFETRQLQADNIVALAPDSNVVYAACSGRQLRFVRIPLDGQPVTYLGEAVAEKVEVHAATVAEGRLLVGTSQGIFIVSTATGDVQRLGTAQGLPSDLARAVAVVDGVLYAALGDGRHEGFLIAYDLKTKACKYLHSTRRQAATNPLDQCLPPVIITGLFADPARHRVVVTVTAGEYDAPAPLMGIWEIKSGSSRLTQLVPMYGAPAWAARTGTDTIVIQIQGRWDTKSPIWGVLAFDLVADQPEVLFTASRLPVGPKVPTSAKVPRIPWVVGPPYLLAQDWLWFTEKPRIGRLSKDGVGFEYFQNTTPPVQGWNRYLTLPGGRHVLAGDTTKLWLLTLPEKKP